MANTKSAEKRRRQSLVRRNRNRAYRSRMRTAIKELQVAVGEGKAKQAKNLLPATLRLIDATTQKGVLHRNAAARRKSRLTRLVASLGK